MRWALSVSPEIPEKDILFPGMCLPGLVIYAKRCFSDQVMPEFFMALLQEKAVSPAFLPMIPFSGGAPAPLPSPYGNQVSQRKYFNMRIIKYDDRNLLEIQFQKYLISLDNLPPAERVEQVTNIVCLIQFATPDELRTFEMHLQHYKGEYKNDFKDNVKLRKAAFPNYKEALHEQLKVILKAKEDRYAWKYVFALGLFTILGLLIAGTIVAKASKQLTSNYSKNATNSYNGTNLTGSEKANSSGEGPTSTSQKDTTQPQSYQGYLSGFAVLGIVIAFILWAYGFPGIFGYCSFRGQIQKDLDRLAQRQLQIERLLIWLEGDGIFIKYQALYFNELRLNQLVRVKQLPDFVEFEQMIFRVRNWGMSQLWEIFKARRRIAWRKAQGSGSAWDAWCGGRKCRESQAFGPRPYFYLRKQIKVRVSAKGSHDDTI